MNDQNSFAPASSSGQPSVGVPSYVDEYQPQSGANVTNTQTNTQSSVPSNPWATTQQSSAQVPQSQSQFSPAQQFQEPRAQQPQQPQQQQQQQPLAQQSSQPFAQRQSQPSNSLPQRQSEPMTADRYQDLSQDTDDSDPEQSDTTDTATQALEDQNIFELLGVKNATDEEKEAFLDELQQVIWEDFLENDVELLLTSEEMDGLNKLMGDRPKNDLKLQEEVIVYIEKFIPDLEEVMLEKALELKEEMVRERLTGLREFFADQSDKLSQLDEAESHMANAQWLTAAEVMNRLQT